MRVSELTGHALNWAVSQVEGIDHDTAILNITIGDDNGWFLDYLTWEQGGAIIDREDIAISPLPDGLWRAYAADGTMWAPHGVEVFNWKRKQQGYHPLIAAMRCYVASKLGDEVEIPTELTQGETK